MFANRPKELKPKIALDVYLGKILQPLIEQKDQLPDAYRRPRKIPNRTRVRH